MVEPVKKREEMKNYIIKCTVRATFRENPKKHKSQSFTNVSKKNFPDRGRQAPALSTIF
jgi:hypothetical protein